MPHASSAVTNSRSAREMVICGKVDFCFHPVLPFVGFYVTGTKRGSDCREVFACLLIQLQQPRLQLREVSQLEGGNAVNLLPQGGEKKSELDTYLVISVERDVLQVLPIPLSSHCEMLQLQPCALGNAEG